MKAPTLYLNSHGVASAEAHQVAVTLKDIIDLLRDQLIQIRSELAAQLEGIGVSYMARNKSGFTREQAKELFYSFRKKQDDPESPEPDEPEDTDARFAKIMDYMEETSKKLDRIEDDVAFLKDQVSAILKRL